ncbi:MAG: histidinol-phosphate transaminase [Proteobacteria bacterium]|nr:histidinol-phosphate transaminase [Pseudomonadota bacterium]
MRIKEEIKNIKPYFIDEKSVRFKLDANESPYDLPDDIKEEMLSVLKDININRYPDPSCKSLRKLISKMEEVEENQIIFGNGSDELIYLLLMCIREGALVTYPEPGFSMYSLSGKIFGKELIPYKLSEIDFSVDADSFDKVMNREPYLCFIANPNNPTGNCFPDDILIKYLDNENTIFVSDEAYSAFSGHSLVKMVKTHKNLLIMKTLSKIGFASIRLGYLIGNRELIKEIEKVRLPYNINSFSQKIAEFYFKNIDLVNRYVSDIIKERERIYKELKSRGVFTLPSLANFITFKVEKNGFYDYLVNNGVLIKDLFPSFGMKNYYRFTIGKKEENDFFMKLLLKFMEEE